MPCCVTSTQLADSRLWELTEEVDSIALPIDLPILEEKGGQRCVYSWRQYFHHFNVLSGVAGQIQRPGNKAEGLSG